MEELIELNYRRPQPPLTLPTSVDLRAIGSHQQIEQIKADPNLESRLAKLQKLKLDVMASNPRFTGIQGTRLFAYYKELEQIDPEPPIPIDPESFNPHKSIMTRYGKKLLEQGEKYYGKYTINGNSEDEYKKPRFKYPD